MISICKRNDKPNKKGLYAVRLRVCKEGQRKYIALKIFAENEYWDAESGRFYIQRNVRGEQQKAKNDQHKEYNYILDQYVIRAKEIIDDFRKERVDWTLNQFDDAFRNRSKQGKIKPFFEAHIKNLRDTGHFGNANNYAATLKQLENYDNKLGKRVFSEIDIKYVNAFDIHLQKRGCSGNSRMSYLRVLCAIWNKAIKDKEAPAKAYPFGSGGFQIARLREETTKRYLPKKDLDKLKTTRSNNPQTEYARKLFLLSYYCYGISFIDMALLTKSNVTKLNEGEYIVYKRHKLKHHKAAKSIPIKINEEIRALLAELNEASPAVENYLVPIVSASGYKGEKLYKHIRAMLQKCNTLLSELAKEFDITDIKLTTYVSRHTMAMTLQQSDVAREKISQMLGHADMKMTNTYLDSFDTTTIDEAAKVL